MNKYRIFRVGGAVRDKFLGLKSKDIDFAIEAPSYESMKELIISLKGQIFLETPEYFTIRANVPNLGPADYVLCRKDGAYKDGRHPENVEVGTILDDLSRRDFTCNAIAVNIDTDEIVDPWNGLNDIVNKTLKCVGDTKARMTEDGLRGYRAMRFSITKGFTMSVELENFLLEAPDSIINSISKERILSEMGIMFKWDTTKSIGLINKFYNPWFNRAFNECGIWLTPTLEKR